MKTKILVLMAALACIGAVVNRFELPLAKVSVRVLDEAGSPVDGATVTLGFRDRFSSKDVFTVGATNTDGLFSAAGGCDASGLAADIAKSGYYNSGAPIPKFSRIDQLTNHWLPWNETYTTVLRPIKNPVPLCAKQLRKLDIPVLGQPCGYDLEKGDWVAPWGRGEHADFIFTAKREYHSYFEFTADVMLTFSQPGDGLAATTWADAGRYSTFHWERNAPETGYQAPHEIRLVNHDRRSNRPPEMSFDDRTRSKGYFFRVRTIEKDGRIISANYGRISGDIGVDARDTKTCYVYFTYYFNPTARDRNLEWNPKRDLLTGLRYDEIPREP